MAAVLGIGGVFFKAADGAEFRAEMYSHVTQRKLMFLTPLLPAGEYKIEVRNRGKSADAPLREPRVGRLNGVAFVVL